MYVGEVAADPVGVGMTRGSLTIPRRNLKEILTLAFDQRGIHFIEYCIGSCISVDLSYFTEISVVVYDGHRIADVSAEAFSE